MGKRVRGGDQSARADIGDPFEATLKDAGVDPDPRFGLFAYPRNPVGRGYLIDPTQAAFDACALPLIEDPQSQLTPDTLVRKDFVCWPEGPAIAGFGWLSYGYFPRSALLGAPPLVYDGARLAPSAFREVKSGDIHEAAVRPDRPLQERLSVGATQSSAIAMRVASVVPGDVVVLHGLHPKETRWVFKTPGVKPRIYLRLSGRESVEMPGPQIRTVLLQPDDNRLILVWTSELPQSDTPPGSKRLPGMQHAIIWE